MARRKVVVDPAAELLSALKDLCAEKEIEPEVLFAAIESALVFAYKKNFNTDQNVEVTLDRETGAFHVYALKEIVENVEDTVTQISLPEALAINPRYELGDTARLEVTPKNFGRIAAQAAKQFVVQKVREAERGSLYNEFTSKENDIVTGNVVRIEDGNVIVDIGKAEAILVRSEQISGETYNVGDHIRAYIAEVKRGGKGPQVYISRTHPGFLRKLFELEVPEIKDGIIEIKSIAREAGSRSKIAVMSKDENIDSVGSCVGERGMRVQAIVNELGAEKIDVVQWSEEPGVFIANALSPSKVMRVAINETDKVSRVVVPDNQLSLAIGKEGQNARLSARLTGWKIDIKSKSQAKEEPIDETYFTKANIKKSTAYTRR